MSKISNWYLSKVAARQASDEEGQGLAEYGLILALVAVACIGVLGLLGGGLADKIQEVVDGLAGA